jgi:transposase
VLDGKVIGRCMQRHRHQEFIRFLNAIEAEVPAGKIVHVILDNYGPHKYPKTRAWLDRHPRFVFHYTPTSCSWLNAVEGFFAKLSKRRLKRGVFRSIVDLQGAIKRFLREANDDPKPFTWTADPDKIIAAVRRGHQVLDSIPLVPSPTCEPRASHGRYNARLTAAVPGQQLIQHVQLLMIPRAGWAGYRRALRPHCRRHSAA